MQAASFVPLNRLHRINCSSHLLKMASSSLLLPSISAHPISFLDSSGSLKSSASLCFKGFGTNGGIRGLKGCRNLDKSRVFMGVPQTTTVDDALFLGFKPTSAFLFPGQVLILFLFFWMCNVVLFDCESSLVCVFYC